METVSRFGTSISMLRPSIILKSVNAKCLSPGASLSLTFLNSQQLLRSRRLSIGHPNAFVSKVPPSTWTQSRVSVRRHLNRTLSTGLSLHLHRCSSSRDSAKKTAEGRMKRYESKSSLTCRQMSLMVSLLAYTRCERQLCLSPGASLTLMFLNSLQLLRTRRLSKGHPNAFVSKVPPSTWTYSKVSVRRHFNRMLSTGLSLHLHRCSSSRDSDKKPAEGRAAIIGIHLSRREMTGSETGLDKRRWSESSFVRHISDAS
ncbi:antitoxin ChpS [Striga asiatica]|uniref:Antitoxin ChpS n=1 Tax=Striga asiatica TaxID=4170 RepID=A0A5A7Q5M7_STRAF|nr:antitoxin ChpS [Striga asiatica]